MDGRAKQPRSGRADPYRHGPRCRGDRFEQVGEGVVVNDDTATVDLKDERLAAVGVESGDCVGDFGDDHRIDQAVDLEHVDGGNHGPVRRRAVLGASRGRDESDHRDADGTEDGCLEGRAHVDSGGVRSVRGVSGEPDRTDTVTPTAGSVAAVHILLATDADWIVDEVTAALGGPETSFTVCREGRLVSRLVDERSPDLVIVDMQIGSMGGMAVVKALRLDESAGVLPHARVIMLLDRVADLYLAQRSDAEGWLVKPLDALRLRRATKAVVAGGTFTEGVPSEDPAVDEPADVVDDAEGVDESETATTPEGDSVPTG